MVKCDGFTITEDGVARRKLAQKEGGVASGEAPDDHRIDGEV